MKLKTIVLVIMYLLCVDIVLATTFFDSAYNLKQNGNPINGDLQIRIYDSDKTLAYTETFINAITNGTYGVTVGITGGLVLFYGDRYYKDYSINGIDVNFTLSNGSVVEMLEFVSNMGEIKGSAINESTLELNNTYYDWNWISNIPFIIRQIAQNGGINSSMIDVNSVTNDMIVSLNWTRITNIPAGLNDGDNDYCQGGVCSGNLQVNGNMTVLGTYINLTVIQRTANGSINPELNNTFDLGNETSYWRIIYGHINWSDIIGKPQGFDDNIDNDTTYSPGNYIQISASNLISLNEAQLNATIDAISSRYNQTTDFNALNNSKLDKTDQRYNESFKIDAVFANISQINASLWQNASDQAQAIGNLQANATAQAQEIGNLMQNASDQAQAINNLWINATGQTQEINWLRINVSDIWSSVLRFVTGPYLFISGQTIELNETKLNQTIDARVLTYNESARIDSINNSLNSKIDAVNSTVSTKLDATDQRYNETAMILSVNNSKLNANDQRYNETSQINAVNQSASAQINAINANLSNYNDTAQINALQNNITQNYYNKTENYNKTQVYNKSETYSKTESYNKSEIYNKTEVDSLITSAQGTDFNSTGYILETLSVFSLNETKLNQTISAISTGSGAQVNFSGNISFYFNQTPITFNGSLGSYSQAAGKMGYDAGNAICSYYFPNTHFCHYFEILDTMQYKNTSQLSTWTGYAWVNTGGAKYAPATVPFDDCKGWTQGDNERGGNFYLFTEGFFGAVKCGTPNEKALACCKIW